MAAQQRLPLVQYQENYYNNAELSEMLLKQYVCGTLHLDGGVTKEMKEKIKYLK